jgi:hypothetical protein
MREIKAGKSHKNARKGLGDLIAANQIKGYAQGFPLIAQPLRCGIFAAALTT